MLAPGRSGRQAGVPGLIVRECVGLSLASLVARRGMAVPLARAASASFGVELPTTPRAAVGGDLTFVWAGPGNWLVEKAAPCDEIETLLAAPFAGLASLCDQSDSRIMLDLAGPRVSAVLAKGVPIDLDPARFRGGDVALTAAGHIGIQLRRDLTAPSFRLAVARSYFGSLWHWLAASAAEFGCEVVASGDDSFRDSGG
jgi:sarcosine oxidase subunit gamma